VSSAPTLAPSSELNAAHAHVVGASAARSNRSGHGGQVRGDVIAAGATVSYTS
jgi:hypothetical protein